MTDTSPTSAPAPLAPITRTSSRGGYVAEVTLPATPERAEVKVTSQPKSTRETAMADLRLELRRFGVRL